MTPPARRMAAVMIVAVGLRLWGIGFGLPGATARPDETQIAGPAVGYLSGDLRPPFFQWPPLFQYVVAVAYLAYAVVGRPFTGFASVAAFAESRRQSLAPFLYISRSLSMLFGVWTVWLVYRIGRRVWDETVAAIAALFLAVSFLHVRDSHFGVSDVPMTALLMWAVVVVLQWQERGGMGLAALAGLATGLAGGTKYNALGASVAFAVAWYIRLHDVREARRATIAAGAIYALIMATAFLGTSPYIVIDWTRFLHDVRDVQGTLANGPAGLTVGRGWWYIARVVLPSALGWPVFALGTIGIVGLWLADWRRAAVLFAFPLAYYLILGRGYGVFARHSLPLLPFLCLSAAWTSVEVARAVVRTTNLGRVPLAASGLAILVAAAPAWASIQNDRLLATTDNRIVVARALPDIIPPGATFYQSGEAYGHVPMGTEGHELAVRQVAFDMGAGQFTPGAPEWVLIQRSPLSYYSAVPDALEQILTREYSRQRDFPTGAGLGDGRIYDQQDAFYLPLSGFDGITRPGPSFELYRRRQE